MSAEQRAKGEAMRVKYARVFDADINLIKVLCLENGDVQVWHAFLCGPDWPVWSLGGTDGVTALVTGTWVEALSIAQGRAQHDALEKLVYQLKEQAANLQSAAHYAESAATNAASAATACIVRAETAGEAPRKEEESKR